MKHMEANFKDQQRQLFQQDRDNYQKKKKKVGQHLLLAWIASTREVLTGT